MPELPDIMLYMEALNARVLGQGLHHARIFSPFLLRTASPGLEMISGKRVVEMRRIGKRIVFGFEGDLWLVLHLMIAGRLHWTERTEPRSSREEKESFGGLARARRLKRPGRNALAEFHFERGFLTLTETGTRKRASLHLVQGQVALESFDPGGLEVLGSDTSKFAERLTRENHTLKRALTDPQLFSGIGNAYSDEILHRAQLSPVTLTRKLCAEEIKRLHAATIEILSVWTERLRKQQAGRFPEEVTAFRPEMAVHGKYRRPCPVCGTAIQRIRYAENETNYCPGCQTGGKLLADRSLSLLLKRDWPTTAEELEEMRGRNSGVFTRK